MALINCPECGREISDKVKACPHCGYPMEESYPAVPEPQAKPAEVEQSNGEYSAYEKQQVINCNHPAAAMNKKNLKVIIPAIIGGGIIIMAAVIFLLFNLMNMGNINAEKVTGWVFAAGSEGAVIIGSDGSTSSIDGHIEDGMISKDGSHCIFIDDSGTVFHTDAKGQNRKDIAENAERLVRINDTCAFFQDEATEEQKIDQVLIKATADFNQYEGTTNYERVRSVFFENYPNGTYDDALDFYKEVRGFDIYLTPRGIMHKYDFSSEEITDMSYGDYSRYRISENDLSAAFIEDDTIAIYKNGSKDADIIPLDTEGTEVSIVGVSDDGEIAVWSAEEKGVKSIYVYESGNVSEVCSIEMNADNKYSSTYIDFTDSQKEFVLYNTKIDEIYVKQENSPIKSYDIGGGASYYGTLRYNSLLEKFGTTEEFYFTAEGSNGLTIMHFDKDGKRSKIVSKVEKPIEYAGDRFMYIRSDGELIVADFKEGKLSNEKIIDHNVSDARMSNDGKVAYFTKNYSGDLKTGTLYRVNIDDKDLNAEKLLDDVWQLYITPDGKNAAAITNEENASGDYDSYGELYYISNRSVKIADDVTTCFLVYEEGYIDKNYLLFKQYTGTNGDEDFYDIVNYNGKKTDIILKDAK